MLRSVKYGLGGALVASLVGGTLAFATADKPKQPVEVALVVDGTPQTISTKADDVAGVLKQSGYTVGPHDVLAPAATTAVDQSTRIVLNRGRLVHLSIDGKPRDIWTTALTVDQALDQLGVNNASYVSVSRSKRLPLQATSLDLRTPKQVTVLADGKRHSVVTTGPTVQSALTAAGITVRPSDRVAPAGTTALLAGQTVQVTRVKIVQRVKSVRTEFDTVTKTTDALYTGDTKVVKPGKSGLVKVVYKYTFVNGKLTSQQEVGRTVVSHPVDAQVLAGSKPKPAPKPDPKPAPEPTSSSSSAPASPAPAKPKPKPKTTTSGDKISDGINASPDEARAIAKAILYAKGYDFGDYDCLKSLWGRESGWRVHAENPSGAYGIPQALPGSKMSNAGPDWQDSAKTQILWGLAYVNDRYGSPCAANSYQLANGYY